MLQLAISLLQFLLDAAFRTNNITEKMATAQDETLTMLGRCSVTLLDACT